VKVLQVTSTSSFEVLDLPVPEPGPGQVLMRVEAISTCPQWDLHLRHNEPMFVGHQFHYPYTPGQPGHEGVGTIEGLGPGVEGPAVGTRVCAWRDQGHDRQGCYAQFVVMEAGNVIAVPEDLPAAALAPLELAMCVGTVFRMLKEMDVIAGRSFGVSGLGPAGLVAMQMARAEGATKVVGFDPVTERRQFALGMGADRCLDPTADCSADLPERLQTSVDCHGAKASVESTMDRTSDVVALFGVQREDYTYALRHGGIRLCGYKGHFLESAQYALDLIVAGKLNLAPLCTHTLPLERYGEGIDLLEQRKALKVLYRPWE
jgi:D-arabinose 1-dehydrogenase-like Zn-dependent alcohol dehydrogenase